MTPSEPLLQPDAGRLPPGYTLHRFPSVGSTMDAASAFAAEDAQGPFVVVAGEQTGGRGRQGRGWNSPPGNLYCTIALRPGRSLAEAAQLSLVAGVALHDAVAGCLEDASGLTLKWPNDLLLDGAKIAGILLETVNQGAWVLIGTGVNIASCPPDTPYAATALSRHGAAVSPGQLLSAYAAALEAWRVRWTEEGMEPVREAWLARAQGIGGEITVRTPRETLTGLFNGLDKDGALLLGSAAGGVRRITAGDVHFGATPATGPQDRVT